LTPSPANAQLSFDLLGTRALGMAGAFVAVSDDATASFWNPSGLLGGPLAGVTIGGDRFQFRDLDDRPVAGAGRTSAQWGAFGAWPVGITYARVLAAGIRPDSNGALTAQSLRTTQIGFTVLQSVSERAVLGATIKYIRGTAAITGIGGTSARDVIKAALDASGDSEGAIDIDIGVSAGTERIRAGGTFKNLLRPGFATVGGIPIHLERRVRVGVAAFPRDGVTLAIDVDLDTADPLVGLRRTIAIGGETRLGARMALRGGIRWERSNDTRPIGALGASVRFRGLWLDGYVTGSQSDGTRGLGIALRAGG
jgi:hypothetical protein